MQGIRETCNKAGEFTLDEMVETIKKNGFLADKPIEVAEADGYKGIIEGHHRNFACAILGKTLIPYKIIARDDEKIPYGGGIAKQRINSLNSTNLFDHEVLFEGNGEKFSYNSVYPGIYNKLRQREGSSR